MTTMKKGVEPIPETTCILKLLQVRRDKFKV